MDPGTRDLRNHIPGMHAAIPAPSMEDDGGHKTDLTLAASEVELDMNLLGTQNLSISPIADDNRIDLHSTWPHPSFSGRFLPNERTIDGGGFSAQWQISSLASQAHTQVSIVGERGSSSSGTTAAYRGGQPPEVEVPELERIESINIGLVDPVDIYTQADRASKYGILFIALTFVAFMLFELIKRLSIHPLQYLLVGLALAIFFLLLLGLSEHMQFLKAYLIAASACIALQFFYLSGVLKSWLRAAGFAAMLAALYGVLYSLLISEDNALLMGSLLLFGVLSTIMVLTRKVDWYELTSSPQ
jgi:inner membrane protein